MLKYVLVLVILVLQCVNGPQEPDYSFNISVESAKVTGINDTMIFTAQSDLPGTVRYVWMLDNNPVCDTTDTNIFTTSWKMQDTGIHTISVSAFSGHHKFALPVTKEFLVTYARPQVALKLDTRVSVNDTVVIHALASDSDGVIKSYSWSVDPDGV
ncbi:MAG: hypothetical protein GX640_22225, partial [Fibrobacter sp.]|nr:hypothetical protein [Fibrobacter sp.]